MAELNGYLENVLNLKASNYTTISSTDNYNNLDDFLTPRVYRIINDALATTLSNGVINNSGILIVSQIQNSNRILQIYIPNSGYSIHIRKYTNTGWLEWTSLINQQKLDNIIARNDDNLKNLGLEKLLTSSGYISNVNSTDISVITDSNAYVHCIDECSTGNIYYITGLGASTALLYSFVGSDGINIKQSTTNEQANNQIIIAPEGAKYFVYNSRASSIYGVYKVISNTNFISDFSFLQLSLGSYTSAIERTYNSSYICTSKIPTFISAMSIISNDIQVSVVRWDKNGNGERQFWYKNGDNYIFDHINYTYEFYFNNYLPILDLNNLDKLKLLNNKIIFYYHSEIVDNLFQITSNLNSNINTLYKYLGIIPLTFNKNVYITNNISTVDINAFSLNRSYQCAIDSCSQGDIYYIIGSGGQGARLYSFLDNEYNTIYMTKANETTNNKLISIEAPENASYFICNLLINDINNAYKKINFSTNLTQEYSFLNNKFTYGRFDADGNEIFVSNFIRTKNTIDTNIYKISINSSDIRVCILTIDKATNEAKRHFWYSNGDTIIFDHTTYLYKFYIGKTNERAIINFYDEVLCHLNYYMQEDSYKLNILNYINNNNSLMEKNEKLINYLSNMINDLRDNTDYHITYANAIKPIDLVTYAGNNMMLHPKVLYIENGFGEHSYWMAYTPYPYNNNRYENPCIAFSDDGYTWTNIPGNPLDDPEGYGYNSDTHLVYDSTNNLLEVWYRYVNDEVTPALEILKRKKSNDGITWSDAETVLTNDSGKISTHLSPAIIIKNNKYCMWDVNGTTSNYIIHYYEAPINNITNWSLINTFNLNYVIDDITVKPWHIDVIYEDNTYVLCVMCRDTKAAGGTWPLFLATSNDNINYNTPYLVIKGSNNWDQIMYRSTIVKTPQNYRIYYSGGYSPFGGSNANSNAIWGIGISESETLTNFRGYMQMV